MSDSQSLWSTLKDHFVPIHRDGYKFIAIAVSAAVLFWWLGVSAVGWLFALLALWIAYFFRDPDRVTPLRAGLVIAPADGRIVAIARVKPPLELGLGEIERVRVSTYLSGLDVHINRAPVAGRIARALYVPGAFVNPALDKASEENERRALIIETQSGDEIAVVQIAGLVARRIVTFAGEGDTVAVGQRFGLIRFGSRVDVYLPPGKTALAAVGQRAIAGETVLADLVSSEPPRDSRRG
jgi:phosphatidylserine decarboxylase